MNIMEIRLTFSIALTPPALFRLFPVWMTVRSIELGSTWDRPDRKMLADETERSIRNGIF